MHGNENRQRSKDICVIFMAENVKHGIILNELMNTDTVVVREFIKNIFS